MRAALGFDLIRGSTHAFYRHLLSRRPYHLYLLCERDHLPHGRLLACLLQFANTRSSIRQTQRLVYTLGWLRLSARFASLATRRRYHQLRRRRRRAAPESKALCWKKGLTTCPPRHNSLNFSLWSQSNPTNNASAFYLLTFWGSRNYFNFLKWREINVIFYYESAGLFY
jgi:hypothetical protein